MHSAYVQVGIKVQTRHLTTGGFNYTLVSNPFRAATSGAAGAETTMGWTLTRRNPAGRVLDVKMYSGATLPPPFGSNGSGTGTVASSYDTECTTVTDPATKSRKSCVDGLGRLASVYEAPTSLNYVTTYSYDARDNLTVVMQGAQTRSFGYTSLSRLSSATNPESNYISYLYDDNGNLTSRLDARSIATTMSYDPLNRIRTRSYSDGTPAVTYCYDGVTTGACAGSPAQIAPSYPKGRLTWVSSSASAYAYRQYDPLGRVLQATQTTGGPGYSFTYAYNKPGNPTSVSYPSGRLVLPSYDTAGRLSAAAGYFSGALYDPNGAMRQLSYANTLVEAWQRNSRLQPTGITVTNPGTGTQLLGLTFGYGTADNNGNVQSQTITAPGFNITQNYLYDAVNRICAAAEAGSVGSQCADAASGAWYEKFGYDQYGNQWVNATNLQLTSLTPTSSAWFNAATNRFNGVGYDLAGNQTGAGGGTFTFDAENRQITAALGAPLYSQFTYGYDGEGRRVRRTVYGKTRTYVYGPGGSLMAEYHNGALAKEYIYAGSRLLTVADFVDNATTYVTTDHLGSTRLVTNASAAVESRHDYLPFGKEIAANLGGRSSVAGYTATQNILQRFTGKELDPETGLDYFGARYFSGRQGRFTSPDPVAGLVSNPQSLNAYAYVWNNPLRYVDPTGMIVSWEDSKAKCNKGESACRTDLQRRYEDRIKELQTSKNKKDRARGNALAATYEKLQNAKEVFHVVRTEGNGSGELTYRGEPGNLYIEMQGSGAMYGEMPDIMKLGHEFKHGEQFLEGLLGFTNITGKWTGYRDDLVDEANAFIAGFMAEPVGNDQSKFLQGLGQAAAWGVKEVVRKLDEPGSRYRGRLTQQMPITTITPSIYAVPRSE